MATPEQLKQILTERYKTKRELKEFRESWGGTNRTGDGWTEEQYVEYNIDAIVKEAHAQKLLNQLGMRLGLHSDEHSEHLHNVWADRRSWAALIIAIIALFHSILT